MTDDSKNPRIAAIEEALGGKYKILDKIGTGGFGEVYLGEHQQLRRKVAIKILAQNLAGQADVVKRFEREARAAATLSHPNIIDIYDVGESGDIYYFVMKYIDGETLSERMAHDKTISPGEAIHIIKQVADALDYAHDHDIIHRDIKPANIMLDEYGKPVLMDFGVARVQFEANLTKTGTLMGTPHYLPPELPLGKKVDGRSDIYSLGILLYEMLSGRPPFHDENSVALIFKHINDSPDPLTDILPELAPELSAVVHKMIEKLPENRFQTAGEVVDALQELTTIYPPITVAGRRSTPTATRNTEKLLILAHEHLEKEKFSKAIELYATISRRDPNNETAKREISELVTRLVERTRDHISKHEFAQARELLRQANQLSFKDDRLSMARMALEDEERAQLDHKEKETQFGINFKAAETALDRDQPDAAMEALATLEQTPAPREMLPEWMRRERDSREEASQPISVQKVEPEITPSLVRQTETFKEAKKETREKVVPAVSSAPIVTSAPIASPSVPIVPIPASGVEEKKIAMPPPEIAKSSGRKWFLPAVVLLILTAAGATWMLLNRSTTDTSNQNDPALLHKLATARIKPEEPKVAAKPTSGELVLTSTPDGARVVIAGQEKGTTPLKIPGLAFGKYSVKLQLKGYKDLDQDVELNETNAGKEVPLVLEAAAPVVGTLVIESKPPGAVIVMNNRALGVTPKTVANASVGKYNIDLRLEGYNDFSQSVRVKEGQTTTVTAELVAIPKPVVVEKPKEEEIKPGTLVALDSQVVPPKSLKKTAAKYPPTGKKLEGTVRMSALISETGKVIEVKLIQSAHPLLDEAAMSAVKEWIFEPATKKGVPVKVWLPVAVSFQKK